MTSQTAQEAVKGFLDRRQTITPEVILELPLKIPVPGGHPTLDFVRADDRSSAIESLVNRTSLAPDNSIIRIAGGCKGFTPDMQQDLIRLAIEGSVSSDSQRSFRGVACSGLTKEFNADGSLVPAITIVPFIMGRMTECIVDGSVPQTAQARQDVTRNGALIVSKYGTEINEHGHAGSVIQKSADQFHGWDGDVRLYIDAFQACQRHGFKTALVVINGGDVTKDEALLALSKNIPVVLVEGSQRAADELVQAAKSGDPATAFKALYEDAFKRGLLNPDTDIVPTQEQLAKLIKFAQFDKPKSLADAYDQLGLLSSSS